MSIIEKKEKNLNQLINKLNSLSLLIHSLIMKLKKSKLRKMK